MALSLSSVVPLIGLNLFARSVNVAAAVASSGVVVVVVSSSDRARERATAVEAGRPAGRRLISVAGGLADVCV